MDNPEIAKLIQALKDEDGRVRSSAAEALGKVGDVSAVPALIQALKDAYRDIRSRTARALGEIGDASAVPALIQVLKDENWHVRAGAAEALGKIGDVSAVPALIKALRDADGSVRSSATAALGVIGDASAVPALIQALKYPAISTDAAGALERTGDSDSLPRKILAASQLSVPDRINILADLRRVRYKGSYATLRYTFPETRALCQIVLQERDAAACAGAQAVLDWLDGDRDLLRPAQRDTATEPQELLRAAQEKTVPVPLKTLLRQSCAPQVSADTPAPRRNLRERLFGKRTDRAT